MALKGSTEREANKMQPKPPQLPPSCRSIPSSARSRGAAPHATASGRAIHQPAINASSSNVVSARARREQLLAYHVAVRLLEDAGVRQRRSGDETPTNSPFTEITEHQDVSAFFESTTTPLGPSPRVAEAGKLERVQRAVEAYERDRGRFMHETIALDFVDDHGMLLVSPSRLSTPQASAASSPMASGARRGGALPDTTTLRKVQHVFQSGGGFSYFDEKRNEIRKLRADVSDGGSLPPSTDQAMKAMQNATLTFPQLHVSGLGEPLPGASSDDQVHKQNAEDAEGSERIRNERVAACVVEAVAAHMEATAGGTRKFRRRRHSEAFQRGQSTASFRTQATSSSDSWRTRRWQKGSDKDGEDGDAADANDSSDEDNDMQNYCTFEAWLTHHYALRDAVRSTVDLIVFVLMKALPVCLFSGDVKRFQSLMSEEQSVFRVAALLKETMLKNVTPVQVPQDRPPLTTKTGRVCNASPHSDTDNFAIEEACEQQMINLQLKSSQRTERSLSTIHANRLFLLIEVEQSIHGNRVARFVDGMPPVTLGSAKDQDLASTHRGFASPSRATSASSGSPRKVEKIELERERRKREAMRPPRDPLQAVASSRHYWLSLTTARLRQLPFHACRDRALDALVDAPTVEPVDGSLAAPLSARSDPLTFSVGSQTLLTPTLLSSSVPQSNLKTPGKLAGARPVSTVLWSRKTSENGDDRGPLQTETKPPQSARRSTKLHRALGEDDNGFSHPEPAILPVADLLFVLNNPENYDHGADASRSSERRSGGATRLQDVVGPVELRLLLEISTSYAALVQSLHGAATGTSYARFLERNRDRLLRAASDVIVAASIEYLDFVVSNDDGTRGLPRLSRAARAKLETSDKSREESNLLLGVASSNTRVTKEEPWRGLLASLRPFGKKTELSRVQVDAVLASNGQNAMSGGIIIGNEHDARRAASHLVEQNRAVLHEVLARVKGELQFLLTGVDGRTRILEEEQIAVERQKSERKEFRKLRTTNDTNSPSASTDHHGHHAAVFATHRGSLRFAIKGSDIVGNTNMSRFHAMLNELVGSSSEEEEIRQETAYEASDVLRPVFDWQRQNFSREKKVRPHDKNSRRVSGSSGSLASKEESNINQALPKKPTPPSVAPGQVKAPPAPLHDLDLQVPWAEEVSLQSPSVPSMPMGESRKPPHQLTITTDRRTTVISPTASHLTPTAASTSRAKAVLSRLVQRHQSLEASLSLDPGGPSASGAPTIVSPRRLQDAKLLEADALLGLSTSTRVPRMRAAFIVSPRAGQHPLPSAGSPTQGSSSPNRNNGRRRSSAAAPRVRSGSIASVTSEDQSVTAKLSSKLARTRQQFGGAHRGSIFGGGGVGGLAAAVMSDKAKQSIKAGEGLSMIDLQGELIALERDRRRAGRGVSSNSPRVESPLSPQREGERQHSTVEEQPSVTASVVGSAAAQVVEKFKKACGGTIQHFYGAVQGEGTTWYEQGRPCAVARSQRVAAIRGVQQGRFDLTALTPIAALRLAVATTVGGTDDRLAGEGEPTLMYPHRPKRAGGDLVWTL
jgi:hypothetical protein